MYLFETLQNLFEKYDDISSSTPHSSYYMVIKWLSMCPSTIMPAIRANEIAHGLPNWAVGCLLNNLIRRREARPRIDYIHGKKEEKLDEELVLKLSRYLGYNRKRAQAALLILRAEGVNLYEVFGLKEKKNARN